MNFVSSLPGVKGCKGSDRSRTDYDDLLHL